MHSNLRIGAVGIALLLFGCGRCDSPPPPAPPPELVLAPEQGEVPDVVVVALAQAKADRRRLLVYVSATWCEPCQRFQQGLERGEFASELTGIRLLKFDRDRDGARLDVAGYGSEYVPLFVIPEASGRAGP